MVNLGCLWQMELDIVAVYWKPWMFMVDGTRYMAVYGKLWILWPVELDIRAVSGNS